MANLDFAPLYRSTIGFDHVPRLIESALRMSDTEVGYPPYNIEKLSDDAYRIVIALAGFGREDVEVVTEHNRLMVRGKMVEREGTQFLHRGIAGRSFERRFDLAEHIEVSGASFENGLLTIELKRELPEKLKSRKIRIASSSMKREAIDHTTEQAA